MEPAAPEQPVVEPDSVNDEPIVDFTGQGSTNSSATPDFDAGSQIDEELANEASRVVDIRRGSKGSDEAKAGPPRLDEWHDFFSRIVLGFLTDAYIEWLFKDVDENALSEREINLLKLKQDERDRISKPFAELANKLKITRKHGRLIIASAGTADSVWVLLLWMGRVNRIAARYRPLTVKPEGGRPRHERPRTDAPSGSGTNNGHGGYTIIQPGTG